MQRQRKDLIGAIDFNIPIKEGFTFIEWQLDGKPYKSENSYI